MVVTTTQKANQKLAVKATQMAQQLDGIYEARKDRSILRMYDDLCIDRLLVVGKEGLKWYIKGIDKPFFFHPGLSVVRIKRLIRGDNDIMIETCQLKPGDSFLDCTLGLAADAIVASYAVGAEGKVVGVESQSMIACLVSEGLQAVEEFPELDQAAKQIEVWQGHHEDFLASLPDRSFDVVYFDPMFRAGIAESPSLQQLRNYANPLPLSVESIEHAKRVARRRVVVKERKDSGEFERLGLTVLNRENMQVAYGIHETLGRSRH